MTYTPEDGRFELPIEHAAVLADDQSPASLIGGFEISIAQWAALDRAAEAFKSGVGWHAPRRAPLHRLRAFLPAAVRGVPHLGVDPPLGGVVAKLQAGGRVLDVGCGHGSSSIMIAKAFPGCEVVGIDYHAESIEAGRKAAAEAGVSERVSFAVADAAAFEGAGFDLACFFDALHDMGDPVGAPGIRRTLDAERTLLVVEPLAGDRLEDNFHPLGVAYYASSTLLCVPNSLSQDVGAALGAQAGESRLREVLEDAGFARVRRACDAPFNLVLEAR